MASSSLLLNVEPITLRGIQSQNPQLFHIYKGRRDEEPKFIAIEEKTRGSALGAIYQKFHSDPAHLRKRWIGKIGYPGGRLRSDPSSVRTRTKKEINLDTLLEKLASDFYEELGRGIFLVPRTRLSTQSISNPFTAENYLVLHYISMGIRDTLQIMSKFVNGYKDFREAETLDADGNPIAFLTFIERYHRPPDRIFGPDKTLIPLRGFMGLLAVGRVLADPDLIGGTGGNAGFVVENASGVSVARTVKIDPGYAFSFDDTELNRVIRTHRRLGTYMLDNIKDMQTSNSGHNTVHWEALSEHQKNEFLATLFNCSRYLRSRDVLHFLFYRDGKFTSNDIEQLPKEIAISKEREMADWIRLQLEIYKDELAHFCNEHPSQVARAYYVDDCGELSLPLVQETFPIRELFTQLVLDKGHREPAPVESPPERDSLTEAFHRMLPHQTTIPVEGLFDPTETTPSPKKILMIGCAGVGKSTLCQKIAHDWASGRLWEDRFVAVYWIPLRLLNGRRDFFERAHNTDDFLASVVAHFLLKNPSAKEGVLRQLQEERQQLLIIFDGYDEATEELTKIIQPILCDPQLHVLLSSRPGATADLRFDRKVENRGFSDAQVESFVHLFFQRQVGRVYSESRIESFLSAIKKDSNLFALSHIPLQLQMLCGLWERGVEKSGFATNISSLYLTMVDQLFNWECQRQGKDLSSISIKEKEEIFTFLGRLALYGFSSGNLISQRQFAELCHSYNVSERQIIESGVIKAEGIARINFYCASDRNA